MREDVGQAKSSLTRCMLRRRADKMIHLDDEGCRNQARISREKEALQAAHRRENAEWFPLTSVCILDPRICDSLPADPMQTCDACRINNGPCVGGIGTTGRSRRTGSEQSSKGRSPYYLECDFCFENSSLCGFSLAYLNISWPHQEPPPPHMVAIFFAEHDKEHHREAKQTHNGMDRSSSSSDRQRPIAGPSGSGNHALQDYQMQLMLLEQEQTRRRLLISQQRSDRRECMSSRP